SPDCHEEIRERPGRLTYRIVAFAVLPSRAGRLSRRRSMPWPTSHERTERAFVRCGNSSSDTRSSPTRPSATPSSSVPPTQNSGRRRPRNSTTAHPPRRRTHVLPHRRSGGRPERSTPGAGGIPPVYRRHQRPPRRTAGLDGGSRGGLAPVPRPLRPDPKEELGIKSYSSANVIPQTVRKSRSRGPS